MAKINNNFGEASIYVGNFNKKGSQKQINLYESQLIYQNPPK